MGFGAVLAGKIANASESARAAARELGAAASSGAAKAADLAQRSARAVKDATVAGAHWAADTAASGARTAAWATAYVARKAVAAEIVGASVLTGAAAVVAGKTAMSAGSLVGRVKGSFDAVKEKFLPHQKVAAPVLECMGQDLEEDRRRRIEKRGELIGAAGKSDNPVVRNAAAELRDDMKAVEMARLAENSYAQFDPAADDAQKRPPAPWKAMTPEEAQAAGISPDLLQDAKAVIYQLPDSFPFEPKTVVAFRGTTSEAGDVIADHDQALGKDNVQYQAARKLGMALKDKMPGAEVTGHSLGGGKAQAAGVAGGLHGQMFNSAGLHPKLMGMSAQGAAAHADKFKQYRSEGGLAQGGGDPLTGIQNSPAAQEAAYRAAQGMQGVARANQWALSQLGVDDPLALLPDASQQLARDMADRILHMTPQQALANKEFSKGKWYIPPAIGEVRGVRSKNPDGTDTGIAAQHSITNLVYGIEERKSSDIATLLQATGAPGKPADYIGRMTMR